MGKLSVTNTHRERILKAALNLLSTQGRDNVTTRNVATAAPKMRYRTGGWTFQAKSEDEMQAVADALSLPANIVMAWNTAKMQAIFDRWTRRGHWAIPPELVARCVPARTEGLNIRGIVRFPIELYLEQLLPSWVSQKIKFWSPKSALAMLEKPCIGRHLNDA